VVVGLQLLLHQGFDLLNIERTTQHHAQVVANEFGQVMVFGDAGVFFKQRTGFRLFNVGFQGHQAIATNLLQNFKHQAQEVHALALGRCRRFERLGQSSECGLQVSSRVTGNEIAHGQTHNTQHLGRLPKHPHVSAVKGVPQQGTAQSDDHTNYPGHVCSLFLPKCLFDATLP